jgi:[acyl-carrier-protein] S-malonyltransferase
MGLELWRSVPEAKEVFDEADEVLGFPLSRLCFEGPEDLLKQTQNAQPAILTASMAAYRAIAAKKSLKPLYVAGHSFGEYSALVVAGALQFKDAVRLVRRRGQLMSEATPPGAGGMAALLGLDVAAAEELLAKAKQAGVVEVATLNCPGQVVIAGETKAIEEAKRLASAAGFKVMALQVSGPFHSSLMKPAAERFAVDLAQADFQTARIPVIANVTAQPVSQPDEIKQCLLEQIYSPVRWEESIRHIYGQGVRTFIEIGPGKVLAAMVRRVHPDARIINIGDERGLKESLAILEEV